MGTGGKPAVGDVFSVSLSPSQHSFGQILGVFEGQLYLVVLFDLLRDSTGISIDAIVASDPVFIANTFDAKIVHGDWHIIGNVPPDRARFPFPKYKVGSGSTCYVEAFDGRRCRQATAQEERLLPFRRGTSPQVLEEALKDHFGLFDWSPVDEQQRSRLKAAFEALKAEIALGSAGIE